MGRATGKPPGRPPGRVSPYTSADDLALISYMLFWKEFSYVSGLELWKRAEEQLLLQQGHARTWQSMRERWLRHVFPKLLSHYGLHEALRESFELHRVPPRASETVAREREKFLTKHANLLPSRLRKMFYREIGRTSSPVEDVATDHNNDTPESDEEEAIPRRRSLENPLDSDVDEEEPPAENGRRNSSEKENRGNAAVEPKKKAMKRALLSRHRQMLTSQGSSSSDEEVEDAREVPVVDRDQPSTSRGTRRERVPVPRKRSRTMQPEEDGDDDDDDDDDDVVHGSPRRNVSVQSDASRISTASRFVSTATQTDESALTSPDARRGILKNTWTSPIRFPSNCTTPSNTSVPEDTRVRDRLLIDEMEMWKRRRQDYECFLASSSRTSSGSGDSGRIRTSARALIPSPFGTPLQSPAATARTDCVDISDGPFQSPLLGLPSGSPSPPAVPSSSANSFPPQRTGPSPPAANSPQPSTGSPLPSTDHPPCQDAALNPLDLLRFQYGSDSDEENEEVVEAVEDLVQQENQEEIHTGATIDKTLPEEMVVDMNIDKRNEEMLLVGGEEQQQQPDREESVNEEAEEEGGTEKFETGVDMEDQPLGQRFLEVDEEFVDLPVASAEQDDLLDQPLREVPRQPPRKIPELLPLPVPPVEEEDLPMTQPPPDLVAELPDVEFPMEPEDADISQDQLPEAVEDFDRTIEVTIVVAYPDQCLPGGDGEEGDRGNADEPVEEPQPLVDVQAVAETSGGAQVEKTSNSPELAQKFAEMEIVSSQSGADEEEAVAATAEKPGTLEGKSGGASGKSKEDGAVQNVEVVKESPMVTRSRRDRARFVQHWKAKGTGRGSKGKDENAASAVSNTASDGRTTDVRQLKTEQIVLRMRTTGQARCFGVSREPEDDIGTWRRTSSAAQRGGKIKRRGRMPSYEQPPAESKPAEVLGREIQRPETDPIPDPAPSNENELPVTEACKTRGRPKKGAKKVAASKKDGKKSRRNPKDKAPDPILWVKVPNGKQGKKNAEEDRDGSTPVEPAKRTMIKLKRTYEKTPAVENQPREESSQERSQRLAPVRAGGAIMNVGLDEMSQLSSGSSISSMMFVPVASSSQKVPEEAEEMPPASKSPEKVAEPREKVQEKPGKSSESSATKEKCEKSAKSREKCGEERGKCDVPSKESGKVEEPKKTSKEKHHLPKASKDESKEKLGLPDGSNDKATDKSRRSPPRKESEEKPCGSNEKPSSSSSEEFYTAPSQKSPEIPAQPVESDREALHRLILRRDNLVDPFFYEDTPAQDNCVRFQPRVCLVDIRDEDRLNGGYDSSDSSDSDCHLTPAALVALRMDDR